MILLSAISTYTQAVVATTQPPCLPFLLFNLSLIQTCHIDTHTLTLTHTYTYARGISAEGDSSVLSDSSSVCLLQEDLLLPTVL